MNQEDAETLKGLLKPLLEWGGVRDDNGSELTAEEKIFLRQVLAELSDNGGYLGKHLKEGGIPRKLKIPSSSNVRR